MGSELWNSVTCIVQFAELSPNSNLGPDMPVGTLWFVNFPSFYTVQNEGSLNVPKILSMDDVLRQMNSVHIVSPYFTEFSFRIILHCTIDCQVVT